MNLSKREKTEFESRERNWTLYKNWNMLPELYLNLLENFLPLFFQLTWFKNSEQSFRLFFHSSESFSIGGTHLSR